MARDIAEVDLARAAGNGDAKAIEEIERRYVASLRPVLRGMRLDEARIDDVLQTVRSKLLMRTDEGTTRIEEYAGEGKLAALVRVVAVRTALDQLRGERRRPDKAGEVEHAADVLLGEAIEPELRIIRQRHNAAFKAAFQHAVAALTPKERGILRMHLVDRLAIDDIGALHNVHRSSAARWLVAIRKTLGETTRSQLQEELDLNDAEFESLYRAVDSQLDLSFSRILEE